MNKPFLASLTASALLGVSLTAFASAVQAAGFEYRIPMPGLKTQTESPVEESESLSFSLTDYTLPEATRGQLYSFDFTDLLAMAGEPQPATSGVRWSVGSGGSALPAGMSLSVNGLLSGTPAATGETDFEVVASYENASGQRMYRIVVGGVELAVTQIAAGWQHTCVVLMNKTLKCWGLNSYGQLGDGSTTMRSAPTTVLDITNVVSVSAGYQHTCAVLENGTVRCWGLNDYGQLGNNSITNSQTPVTVSGLTNVESISTRYSHNCVKLYDKTVKCWGLNINGQVGNNGGSTRQLTPALVPELASVVRVTAGPSHTCAVLADTTAKCWGRNHYGQLGSGSATERRPTPATVTNLMGVKSIAAGYWHTCAVLADRTAKCWGYNNNGQLGDASITNRMTPVSVTDLANVESIAPGYWHTCAVLTDGTAECWGLNDKGQLGDASLTGRRVPVTVGGLSNAANIVATEYHTCAMLTDRTAKCWGGNGNGNLGDGSTTMRLTPVEVQGLEGAE